MIDVIRLGKRAFAWVTVVATVTWSVGLAAFVAPLTAQAAVVTDGDLIKGSLPTVYYYHGNKKYVFPTQKTFLTWYTMDQLEGVDNGGLVKTVTNAEIASFKIGANVTAKPGARMVKITSDPATYAVDAGGQLRHVTSEAAAVELYGSAWNTMIDDVPDGFFVNYKGSEASGDIASSSDFNPAAVEAAATSIALDLGLDDSNTPPAPTPTPAGGSLSVGPSSSNPGAMTLVTDTGNNAGGQRADVLGLSFSAGSDAVSIDTLVLRRSGIASDSDLDDMYLYNGMDIVAQVQSVSKGVATFTKSGGLFTVPAGGTTNLDLKVDVNKDASAGITIGWSLAAADVTSSADSVSGSVSGSNHTVAVVSDLAFLDIANVLPAAADTIDPQDDYDLWTFRLDANSQDMLVEYITVTNVGSTDDDDLQNIELWYQGSTQLGNTLGTLDNGTATFDLTGSDDGGFKITSGQQRQLTVRADIKGGTNRTIRFGIQEQTDVIVKDLNYNVYTVPAQDDNSAFAVTQAGGATTINTGTLTQTIATDSPTGNIPDGATNVLLAKYNFKASGEPVKVKNLDISCSGNAATNILKNVKISFDGSQIGSTLSTLTCDASSPSGTDFSFGNSFTIQEGASGVVEVHGDLTDSTIASADTVSVTLAAGSSNANGTVSLTALSTTSISGRTLTVKSGAVSVRKNPTLANYTSSRPLGVLGSSNVRAGSFIITGGAEASTISQIVLKDDVDTTSDGVTLKDYFDNLSIKHGDTMLHSSPLSLTDTDSTTYTFNLSPNVTLGVGETYVVDVYVDILSSAGVATSNLNDDDTDGAILVDSVVATGVETSTTTSDTSTDPKLQRLNIATNGSLRVTIDGDTPQDDQLVLGATDQTFAKFKLAEESNAEDILIKKFVVADVISINTAVPFSSTGTMRNLKLYNGSTLLGSVDAMDDSKTSTVPVASFDLTGLAAGGFKLAKGSTTVLTLKADLTPWLENESASSTHRATIFTSDADLTTAAQDDYVDAIGLGSGFAISTTNATATSGLVIGVATGATQTALVGNVMDALRTKISIAYSDDAGKVSPSGTVTKSSEQTLAILKISNTANVGGYEATVKGINLDVNSSGISLAGTRALKIYKDRIDTSNQLATTTYALGSANAGYSDTAIDAANMTDITVSAGSSRYVYVTLDTNDSSIGANDTLSVGIQTSAVTGIDGEEMNPVLWSDGAALTLTEVRGMPLTGRSVSY